MCRNEAKALEAKAMLEAALDISSEVERTLCRLSELVYFCLEMRYRRIGLAFCQDLLDASRILASVLRRFFEVVPVWCKVGGVAEDDTDTETLIINGPPPGTPPVR